MKLLTLTTRYYLALFLIMMGLGSFIFYAAMKQEVYVNADEALLNRKNSIIRVFTQKSGNISKDVAEYSDFSLEKITKEEFTAIKDIYSDTLIFEPTDNEFDDYRKLQTAVNEGDQYYKLSIVKPQLENEEIIAAIAIGLSSLSLLLFLALTLGGKWLNQKLWKPFYHTLDSLDNFQLDRDSRLGLPEIKIKEFNQLNHSLNVLAEKNYQVYLNQKNFIENASHEIQTPLAIIRSKTELLMQEPKITKKNALLIHAIAEATDRLSRLNKTLLLLVKIENKQFIEKENINVSVFLNSMISSFSEQYEDKNIKISTDIAEEIEISANPALTEILFGNLIKNAFVHNFPLGFIKVCLHKNSFTIENSGPVIEKDTASLFDRFIKITNHPQHIGLGLALVKQICETYGYSIHYNYENQVHKITLLF